MSLSPVLSMKVISLAYHTREEQRKTLRTYIFLQSEFPRVRIPFCGCLWLYYQSLSACYLRRSL